jgi:hypothetical protein
MSKRTATSIFRAATAKALLTVLVGLTGVALFASRGMAQRSSVRHAAVSRSGADFELSLRISGGSTQRIPQVREALNRLDEFSAAANQDGFEATVTILGQERTFDNPQQARQGVEVMVLAAIDAVGRHYGLMVIATDVQTLRHGAFWQTQSPDKDDLLIFGMDCIRVLKTYPVQAIRRMGLKRIVICQAAALNGQRAAGAGQSGGGNASQDTILINVKDAQQGVASGLHHELYHVFDQSTLSRRRWKDAEWMALNPPGFAYFGYGPFFNSSEMNPQAFSQPTPQGFVSTYAAASIMEDKAETYSAMMLRAAWLEEAFQTDLHLHAKVALIERRMQFLGPEFSPGFWRRPAVGTGD